jgi:hypothetical protein
MFKGTRMYKKTNRTATNNKARRWRRQRLYPLLFLASPLLNDRSSLSFAAKLWKFNPLGLVIGSFDGFGIKRESHFYALSDCKSSDNSQERDNGSGAVNFCFKRRFLMMDLRFCFSYISYCLLTKKAWYFDMEIFGRVFYFEPYLVPGSWHSTATRAATSIETSETMAVALSIVILSAACDI